MLCKYMLSSPGKAFRMKKKRTKGKKWIAAVLLPVFLTAGCGRQGKVETYPDIAEPEAQITFFGNKYEPENVVVIEEILTSFMEENPDIYISYESLKGNDYYDALMKRMETGNGDDIFMVNHDTALQLEEEGKLCELSGLSTIPDFTVRILDQMSDEGEIYWVPTTVSAFGLYCNLDLLEENGQKVPETLPEWEAVCDYFTDMGVTPVIANNDISLKTLAIGRSFYCLYQEGSQKEVFGRINRGEESLGEYLKDGFSVSEAFLKKGYINSEEALVTKKTSEDLELFAQGKAPFMLTGGWAADRVKAMAPELRFTVVPYPVLEQGSVLVINADTRIAVNEDSQYKEEAKKFVEYFTGQENIRKFADNQCSFSPLTGGAPASSEEIQPLIDMYQEEKTVIGADSDLKVPIWDLTAECAVKLLSGEELPEVLEWLDEQAEAGEAGR